MGLQVGCWAWAGGEVADGPLQVGCWALGCWAGPGAGLCTWAWELGRLLGLEGWAVGWPRLMDRVGSRWLGRAWAGPGDGSGQGGRAGLNENPSGLIKARLGLSKPERASRRPESARDAMDGMAELNRARHPRRRLGRKEDAGCEEAAAINVICGPSSCDEGVQKLHIIVLVERGSRSRVCVRGDLGLRHRLIVEKMRAGCEEEGVPCVRLRRAKEPRLREGRA